MWFRVDDKFPQHKKCRRLEGVHFGVWLLAGCWSSQQEEDGRVPREIAYQIAGRCDPRARSGLLSDEPQVIAELVAARLWRRTKYGYALHDFLDYNPSKQEILSMRRARSEHARKAARARWNSTKTRRTADRRAYAQPYAPSIARAMPGDAPSRPLIKDNKELRTKELSTKAFVASLQNRGQSGLKGTGFTGVHELVSPYLATDEKSMAKILEKARNLGVPIS